MITTIKNRVKSAFNEVGAVSFEYVFIIGGVGAVIVGALALGAPSLMTSVLDGACEAADAVLGTATDCTPDHPNLPNHPDHPGP